jgi:peptidoglycan hydrolase-like protein with peptidoglycan-binding domain
MPLVTVQLNPGSTGANVRELHKQLLAIGAVLASGEQTATRYGPSTVAAVHTFQQQYDLPASDAIDRATTLITK